MNSQRSVCLRATSFEVATTVITASLGIALWPTIDPDPAQPFAELLGQWCTLVLLGCAAWGWLVTTLVLLEALRTRGAAPLPGRRRGMPSAYRRLVLGACGIALGAGVAAPALATPGPVHLEPRPAATAPTGRVQVPTQAPEQIRPPARAAAAIVVDTGDSLWRLAADRLPDDVGNATVAHAWRRLYAVNKDVIGADPDHIEPGQRLERPQGW